MKIEVKNIGLIENAEIEIDGISVIAGENGSGKSTIGKALFATFNGFYNLNKKINQIRSASVRNIINDFIDDNYEVDFSEFVDVLSKITDAIINQREIFSQDENALKNFILDSVSGLTIQQVTDEDGNATNERMDVTEDLPDVLQKVKRILSVTNQSIKEKLLFDQLNGEFDRQILNFNGNHTDGAITLTLNGKPLKISVNRDDIGNDISLKIIGDIDIRHEVVYFDSPSILDDLDRNFLPRFRRNSNLSTFLNIDERYLRFPLKHSDVLREQLRSKNLQGQIEEQIATNQIRSIMECLNQVSVGNLERKEGKYGYSVRGNYVNIRNVSSGLKTFITIKQLLTQGALKEKGMVILDEPEVHLHPEWQVLFAKIIVLLQKTFDINFLINTHSPYFMEAIDVFASKFGVRSKVKYYMSSKNDEGNAIVEDVSNCVEKAYAHLARPFQDLENIRYADGV